MTAQVMTIVPVTLGSHHLQWSYPNEICMASVGDNGPVEAVSVIYNVYTTVTARPGQSQSDPALVTRKDTRNRYDQHSAACKNSTGTS